MSLWAHSLIKNEERYIWYSLMSIIEYVDKIMVWDTGSTDKTPQIVNQIKQRYPSKIEYKECGDVNAEQYTVFRQKMLHATKSDWFMILDGDEVWWDESIKKLKDTIFKAGNKLDSIVNPYFNVVGDIFHYQPEKAGKYEIDGKRGHLTIRAMNRKIPGLYTSKPHGQHGYFDGKGKLIQDRDPKKRLFIDAPFLHFTHMVRSKSLSKDKEVIKRNIKYKYELGKSFPMDFYYPEVFFREKPDIVPNIWIKADGKYVVKALIQTPLKKIKRKYFSLKRSGY